MCGHCCPFEALDVLPESFVGTLEPGDRIVIKEGFGTPAVERDTETVIASVEGNSALTADAILLYCADDEGIVLIPGPKLPIVLTTRARELMEQVGLP